MLTSWPEVAEALRGNEYLGRRLDTSRLRRAQVEGLTGSADEKARAIYDMIRRDYVSDGRGGIYAERDLNDVIGTKSGSTAELALLLAALLREAGVPAQLGLISTRGNGRPIELYPIVNQFDRLMVVVEGEGGGLVYLDPNDRHRPYGVLPVASLNGRAWISTPGSPLWVDVVPTPGTATTSLVEATLDEGGLLTGTLQLKLEGYDAERARERMTSEAADAPAQAAARSETVAQATDADAGVSIETVSIRGLEDPAEPLSMSATFEAPAGESIAGELYLTPFVLMQLDENPFERPERRFPVDFAYPFQRTYVASIALPEGYTATEVPEPLRLSIPSRAVSYSRVVGVDAGRLLVRAVLSVDQSQVEPDEYPSLRGLYDEIVAAEAEAIVLVRQGAAPAEPALVEPEGADPEGAEPQTSEDGEAGGGQ